MDDKYEIHLLDCANLIFNRTEGGVLSMDSEGASHAEVLLYRSFPLSQQNHYISVRNPKGDEIGVIESIYELDAESRKQAELELGYRYMTPRVTRIDKIKNNPGMWVWHLQTTLGPVKLSMRNLHEHVITISANRYILSDVDNNRCEIADVDKLDPHSRKQLQQIM